MNNSAEYSLWELLEHITASLQHRRLADVFRFISFHPAQASDSHEHRRIEINYVKKGGCVLHLDDKRVSFHEGDTMIITSGVNHWVEAGANGMTLMQLEFLPEIFFHFNLNIAEGGESLPTPAFLFSEENKYLKIVNNVGVVRAVQRIINELDHKGPHYQYLVVMYYAELLILLYRYVNEAFCTNDSLKKAIVYIRLNYQADINMNDVAAHSSISERYLRKLFSQNLNLSPLDYLNRIRISKSVELLRNTDMSVKEVCYQCGFQSPQYFSRIFKQQMGVSPRQMTR